LSQRASPGSSPKRWAVCPHPGTRPRNPKPAASSRHRDPAARKLENLKLNYREKIALSAPLVNNPG
jgi:hypothetical protein